MPHLLNLKAPPSAKIRSVRFVVRVREDDYRELTDTELESVAIDAPFLELRGDTDDRVRVDARTDLSASNGSQ